MHNNPYKYLGPLNPHEDKLVLVERNGYLEKVIHGILNGSYWSISGPRQVGKTTFLRQIRHGLSDAYYISFDLAISITNEESFYRWLRDKVLSRISSQHPPSATDWDDNSPGFSFISFLEKFRAEDNNKKIIFLFDEIDSLPFLNDFLHIWRKIFHDRYDNRELDRYTVIVTGSADLIAQTAGKTSPFNIAERLYLKDFSDQESEKLIEIPFRKLGIKIETLAKDEILSQLGGHPQMLQQVCFHLVNIAYEENRCVSLRDVEVSINSLFTNNTTIDLLKNDLGKSKRLDQLIREIFAGKKKKYFPYKDFSTRGAGPISEDENSSCSIRNKVFEEYLKYILDIKIDDPGVKKYKKMRLMYEPRFRGYEKIGEGGRGIIYKTRDMFLGRTVAVKELGSDITHSKENFEELLREARAIAKLEHPNIVRVYDVLPTEDGYRTIMEYIEGKNYVEILKKEKKIDLKEVLLVGKSLFAALSYSHKKGVIHRDIKPGNIMKNRGNVIKVIDFGIAIISETYNSQNESRFIIGSPKYISPEQVKKELVDHRSDIYSAGITMFELVTGRAPYTGRSSEIYQKHLYDPVPKVSKFRPGFPDEFAKLIEKCIQKGKEKRFQSAGEALDKLESLEKKLRILNFKDESVTQKLQV